MKSYKATTSLPRPLEFAPGVWPELMNDLRDRSGGKRESGAFLLAAAGDSNGMVTSWLAYDALWPQALSYTYVRLEAEAFSRLWDWCDQHRVKVVADVHTHPWGPRQSQSDRANPMISIAGHVALIVPDFAMRQPRPFDVSFNIYRGNGEWTSFYKDDALALIKAP
jgi:proteasome lid subunit RPN8/RPN11